LTGDETGVTGIVHAVDSLLPVPGVMGDGSLVADTVNCGILVPILGSDVPDEEPSPGPSPTGSPTPSPSPSPTESPTPSPSPSPT
jgi:endoglucanase